MPESKDLTLTPTPESQAITVKRGTLGLRRRLRQLKFDPTKQLIHYVYPQLKPREQAKILLELISYEFPKMKSQEVANPSRARNAQTNIQINLPGDKKETVSIQELVAIAAQDDAK